MQWAYHLILPWTALSILFIGVYSRILRSNVLDTMSEDYVRTARAKGISERQILLRHVLRNSLIPIVTLWGLDFGAVVGGGAILTEKVFDLQGVGQYAAESIAALDVPPVLAITIFGAFFIVLLNTVVDVVYAALDPRIRLGSDRRAADLDGRPTCAVSFATDEGVVQAVDGVSFDLAAGEVLAVVGESGSRQVGDRDDAARPDPLAQRALRGHGDVQGHRAASARRTRSCSKIRGAEIAMIFQDPMASLNPVQRIGDQIAEQILAHEDVPRPTLQARVPSSCSSASGSRARAERARSYPHEFSGGMRQRVMIAMALSCDPSVLIADEPTTALDVTVQAQILSASGSCATRRTPALILVTHDLGVVADIADASP